MPSKNAAQHNLMEMVAHGGKPSSGKGPSVAVAKDFVAADKGKRFAKVQGMRQHNSGGHAGEARRHSTQLVGHASHGAYSMGPRKSGY